MKPKGCILVVDDDPDVLSMLKDELDEAGFHVLTSTSARDALRQATAERLDAVVTDLVMPEMKGDELLRELRAHAPGVPVVIMTAFGTIESAVVAMRQGAYHYLTKPFGIDQLLVTLDNALDERRLRHHLADAAAHGGAAHGLVAHGPAMRRVVAMIERAAPARAPVLVLGESGAGKHRVARALHDAGPRRDRPFVAVHCSTIPEPLLDARLFGHGVAELSGSERGLFQEAEGGTLLLDEIECLDAGVQAKLVAALEDHAVQPLGASAAVAFDVRVVSASSQDLAERVAERRFRQDLLYRLNVITLQVPPLRERPEDLVPLAAELLAQHARRHGREAPTLSLAAMELFRRYRWPGNVRELENTLERALLLGLGPVIELEDLPEELRRQLRDTPGLESIMLLADMERVQIAKALKAAQGNKAAAARLLGVDRKTLYRKLDLYDIKPE